MKFVNSCCVFRWTAVWTPTGGHLHSKSSHHFSASSHLVSVFLENRGFAALVTVLSKEVMDRTCRLPIVHNVVELRFVFFGCLFDSACHFWSLPSARPARFMASTDQVGSSFASSCSLRFLKDCYYRAGAVLPCTPCQLQSDTSSNQDSTQVQPRLHAGAAMQSIRVRVPLVLAKVASLPWKVLITAIPSSFKMSLDNEAPLFLEERLLSRPGFRRHPW